MRVDHHLLLMFKHKTLAAEQDGAYSTSIHIQIQYAMDPRFKIQGGGESLFHNLES